MDLGQKQGPHTCPMRLSRPDRLRVDRIPTIGYGVKGKPYPACVLDTVLVTTSVHVDTMYLGPRLKIPCLKCSSSLDRDLVAEQC